jgi:aldehyde dehydrogenase (NAD(P)+)
MADLFVDLVAPNGTRYSQPTGLFINNAFVASSGQTITSLDPALVDLQFPLVGMITDAKVERTNRLPSSMPPAPKMSTAQ